MIRAGVLGRLQQDLLQAESCFEYARAAEIRTQIARLSAGTATSPMQETTAAAPATRRPARPPRARGR